VTTPVGDRYVVEEMVRGGYNLGGEQSGHIVFLDHNTTGDGLITGLAVLALLVETGRPLSELRTVMQRFPQVLENLHVSSKPDVATLPAVAAAIGRAERELGDRGRVLVRYSGTEPLLRVMVEGEREPTIRKLAHDIIGAARAAIGA
jgi:phosphoglucosamine mutase